MQPQAKKYDMKDTQLIRKNKIPNSESLVLNNLIFEKDCFHLKARLPAHVELDELMQVGMIGLTSSKFFNFDKGTT